VDGLNLVKILNRILKIIFF